ncbi:hypothetical protein TcasGA2_TC034286 [Tribolium castaneum]|uniref:Uncharacterized protein n=1 Tax=Tribolium castaneum TaxID=7070 RepID=A0A139WCR4_TRICA|nr:hypothetical protein TcasGA2_TC034286 [Tribolium castaneum]
MSMKRPCSKKTSPLDHSILLNLHEENTRTTYADLYEHLLDPFGEERRFPPSSKIQKLMWVVRKNLEL